MGVLLPAQQTKPVPHHLAGRAIRARFNLLLDKLGEALRQADIHCRHSGYSIVIVYIFYMAKFVNASPLSILALCPGASIAITPRPLGLDPGGRRCGPWIGHAWPPMNNPILKEAKC